MRGISIVIIYEANTWDTEVWNGVVSQKTREVVHCRHSYPCHCHEVCSGSGKNRSCGEHCDTCYVHSFDVDWDVTTTDGGTMSISTLDSQGLLQPPRWTATTVGEPSSSTHSYTNYIKAAPDTLFRHQGLVENFANVLPPYPSEVYDYYRLNHLVEVGGSIGDTKAWNDDLARINGELGSKKQVNIGLVLVWGEPRDFFYALEQKWIGGKKNDAFAVVGLDELNVPRWAEVMAWTKDQSLQVRLRDAMMAFTIPVERKTLIPVLHDVVASQYQRKEMKEFKYLMASVAPSPMEWLVAMLAGVAVAVGLAYFCYNNDVFGDE